MNINKRKESKNIDQRLLSCKIYRYFTSTVHSQIVQYTVLYTVQIVE